MLHVHHHTEYYYNNRRVAPWFTQVASAGLTTEQGEAASTTEAADVNDTSNNEEPTQSLSLYHTDTTSATLSVGVSIEESLSQSMPSSHQSLAERSQDESVSSLQQHDNTDEPSSSSSSSFVAALHTAPPVLSWRQHIQETTTLSTQLVLAEILQNTLPLVDLAAVGQWTDAGGDNVVDDLAAAALATAWFNLWHACMLGVTTAVDTFTAQAYGGASSSSSRSNSNSSNSSNSNHNHKKDYTVFATWTGNGLVLVWLATIPMGAILLTCETVLTWWGQDPHISRQAGVYCRGLLPGLFALYAHRLLVKHLQMQGITWPAVLLGLAANAFNVGANMILIRRYGLAGAPWATSLTRMVTCAAVLLYYLGHAAYAKQKQQPQPRQQQYSNNNINNNNNNDKQQQQSTAKARHFLQTWPRIDPSILLRHRGRLLVEFGALAGTGAISFAADAWSFEITTVLAGLLGSIALDAHVITLNVVTFLYLSFPFAIGLATTMRVGKWIGMAQPNEARRAAQVSFACTCVVQVLLAILVLSTRKYIAKLFLRQENSSSPGDDDGENVASLVTALLPLSCVLMLADAIHSTIGAVLRGLGRQQSAMWLNLVGFWILAVPMGAIFTFLIDAGVQGLWWGMIVGMYGSALLGIFILAFRVDWAEESIKAVQRVSLAQS